MRYRAVRIIVLPTKVSPFDLAENPKLFSYPKLADLFGYLMPLGLMYDDASNDEIWPWVACRGFGRRAALINKAKEHWMRKPPSEGDAQIDRFKELARELGCDEDEAAFEAALKKVADSGVPPKHEPKKRTPRT